MGALIILKGEISKLFSPLIGIKMTLDRLTDSIHLRKSNGFPKLENLPSCYEPQPSFQSTQNSRRASLRFTLFHPCIWKTQQSKMCL